MTTETELFALFEEGNSVPDLNGLGSVDLDAAAYLATLEQRSSEVTQLETKQTETKTRKSTVPWLIAAGVAAVIGVAVIVAAQNTEQAPVAGQPTLTAGPVTIKTDIDRSVSPLSGTFEVTVGADVLGCSAGTLVSMNSETFLKDEHVMTCESGPNTGTFTIIYDPTETSRWNVLESSDDFAGLQGEGRISFVLGRSSVAETFTGDIEYTS